MFLRPFLWQAGFQVCLCHGCYILYRSSCCLGALIIKTSFPPREQTNMENKTTKQQYVQQAIQHFCAVNKEHGQVVADMENIEASIASCREQKQHAEAQSQQDDNGWRELFRKARGVMTGELKQQHIERIANREMIAELDNLIQELELDEARQKIMCSGSGATLRKAHTHALGALADKELSQSLSALDGVVRAVKLKRLALSAEQAETTSNGRFSEYEIDIDKRVFAEIRSYLEPRVEKYTFDMAKEQELATIGLQPGLSKYMNDELASPVKRKVAYEEIRRKESQLKEKRAI